MIYNFTGFPNDGQNPYGPLAIAPNGTLYGVNPGGRSMLISWHYRGLRYSIFIDPAC